MSRRISWGVFATTSAAVALLVAAEARADAPRGDRPSPREEEPARLPEWIWLNGQLGVQAIDLRTFDANADRLTVGFVRNTAAGPAADVGAGLRLLFLTLGGRARIATFDTDGVGSWQAWSLNGELGIRVPLIRLEPYFTLGGGYTALGGMNKPSGGFTQPLDVSGANVRLGMGLDYYVTPRVTVGASASGEAMGLTRPGVPLADLAEAKRVGTVNEAEARLLEADGSSWGTALTIAAGAGLHF